MLQEKKNKIDKVFHSLKQTLNEEQANETIPYLYIFIQFLKLFPTIL